MQILSEITYLKSIRQPNTDQIESELTEQFGSILRWAVVGVEDSGLKLCVTYEKGV